MLEGLCKYGAASQNAYCPGLVVTPWCLMNHGQDMETQTGDKIIPVNLVAIVCYKVLAGKSRQQRSV